MAQQTAGDAVKLVFDKERKLKARHRYIRDAVRQSGKSIHELLTDPFGGFPYVLWALLQPGLPRGEQVSVDDASELIDKYIDGGHTMLELHGHLLRCVQSYMRLEATATPEEDDPNGTAPATPGQSSGTD